MSPVLPLSFPQWFTAMHQSLEHFFILLFHQEREREMTDAAAALRHVLLNRLAQRWMFCEWFSSDFDWCLLEKENDFQRCLNHYFPSPVSAQQQNFTRRQWNVVRRRFGKPRRFSSAYLLAERKKLEKQRHLLRILRYETKTHHRSEKIFLLHLPSFVLPPLITGTRVLVRSKDFRVSRGQFLGQVENNVRKVRVLFDERNVVEVDDVDVMSDEPLQLLDLGEKLKTMKFAEEDQQKYLHDDDDDDDEELNDPPPLPIPDRLLYLIVRVSRILCAKRDAIDNLRQMNDQAIYERSEQIPLSDLFRRNYARLIQWLAQLNEYLTKFLEEINRIGREIVTDDQLLVLFNDTNYICERSQRLAKDLVEQLNTVGLVTNASNLQLITRLVSLVVQMKEFSSSEGSFLELHALDQANQSFQTFLPPSLLSSYKRCVESSLTHFKSGLHHHRAGLGPLQSFLHVKSESTDPPKPSSSSNNQTFFSV